VSVGSCDVEWGVDLDEGGGRVVVFVGLALGDCVIDGKGWCVSIVWKS
jgi:hypothetical protein